MWKSREATDPPSQFFADVVTYLAQAYPQANLTRKRMNELAPFLVAEWKNGQSAHDAAKATCACDGVDIVRSPATHVTVPKRAARPPKGSVRGEALGLEDLRETALAERLRRQIDKLAKVEADALRHADKAKAMMARARSVSRQAIEAERHARFVQIAQDTQRMRKALEAERDQELSRMSWIRSADRERMNDAAPVKKAPPKKTANPQLALDLSEQDMERLVNEFAAAAMKDKR